MKQLNLFFLLLVFSSTFITAQNFNYGEALQKSLFFYEAQQAGVLPEWNRVSWRSDATTMDGMDVGLDLNGGWYDAGDNVKFNFPMAYSVTVLAWGAIEYEDAYRQSGQWEIIKRNLKYVTDYLIKCHTAPKELYGQLGNGQEDHAFWVAPEVYPDPRPAYKIDASNPGSDLAAETAAAMAATSILFKDSDPAYSATLISHAKELYTFADENRGVYSESITDAANFYKSFSGFQDELVWGAAWLYRATEESTYLTKSESEYANLSTEGQTGLKSYKWGLAWDDKSYGCYVLLAELTGKTQYKEDAERHLDFWTDGFNGERLTYSPGGQAHLTQWGSLRHSSNTALLAFIYSDMVAVSTAKKAKYHDFAVDQINYALGDNPINRSFMVGFGNNPANNVHHRSAHGPWGNSLRDRPATPSHTLFGALAGGPSSPNDQFVDDRGDFIANEVACDYNACLTGALARMYDEFGGNPLSNFPEEEVPNRDEIRSLSKFNSDNDFGATVRVRVQNRTAWPARVTDKLSFRYFMDITEAVNQGFSIDDYQIQVNFSQGPTTSRVGTWDEDNNIYYIEVSMEGDKIAPVGDPNFRREVQISIQSQNGAPYDKSNDWSADGLNGGDEVVSTNVPVYDDGVLIFGREPQGNVLSTDGFNELKLAVYPNPVANTLNISGNLDVLNSAKITITDINGSIITSVSDFHSSANVLNINTADLASGLYFLHIASGNKNELTTKFLKM